MNSSIHKMLLFFIIVLFSLAAHAQNHVIDSLKADLQIQKDDTIRVNTLNEISMNFQLLEDYKNSILFANEAFSLSEKTNFIKGKADAYINIATWYMMSPQSDDNEALKNIMLALDIYKQTKNKTGIADSYHYLGQIYWTWGNISEALESFYKALKIREEIGDKKGIANSYQLIGSIIAGQGDYTEGLKNINAALKIQEEIDFKIGIALSNINIGTMEIYQGNYSEALQKLLTGLRMYEDLKLNWGISRAYNSLGFLYEEQGTIALASGNKTAATKLFTQALKYYSLELKLSEQTGNKFTLGNSFINFGSIYIKLNKFFEARDYLNQSLQLFKATGYKYGIGESYKLLSNLDSIQGKYITAYENYKKYIVYRDSVSSEESNKKSIQLKMQYEFDKKAAIAKADQEKKDAEAKRIKNLQYFVIAGLGVLVLAILLIASIQWRHNKQKIMANALLTQQKEKVEITLAELKSAQSQLIQSEKMASLGELTAGIAHEIQNPLNFVNNFSEVNKELIDELKSELTTGNIQEANEIADDIKENEEKINHHGKRADAIVKGMLQHSRSSTGVKESTNINALADEYLRLAYHGMRAKDKSFNVSMNTDFDESIGNINIIPQEIGRVVLNLITNAFYVVNEKSKQNISGYEPTVSVSTKKQNNKVEIKVADNGNGIPQNMIDKIFQPFFTTKPTGQGTGLGLSLSYDIVKAHGGELKVETKEGEGSEFIIQIPKL